MATHSSFIVTSCSQTTLYRFALYLSTLYTYKVKILISLLILTWNPQWSQSRGVCFNALEKELVHGHRDASWPCFIEILFSLDINLRILWFFAFHLIIQLKRRKPIIFFIRACLKDRRDSKASVGVSIKVRLSQEDSNWAYDLLSGEKKKLSRSDKGLDQEAFWKISRGEQGWPRFLRTFSKKELDWKLSVSNVESGESYTSSSKLSFFLETCVFGRSKIKLLA